MDEQLTLLFFFDVLGFSDRVRELGLAAIYAKYDELLARVYREGAQVVMDADPEGVPFTCVISWHMAYFSDTILLWTEYHMGPIIINAAKRVASRLFCDCMRLSLPVRGAMACGPAIMDKERGIYLGEPLVDAARAESAQACASVGVAQSWGRYFGGSLGRAEGLLHYSGHMKEDRKHDLAGAVLDWPRMWREDPEFKEHDLEETFQSLSRPGYEPYWDSTRALVAFSVENEDWYLQREPNERQV